MKEELYKNSSEFESLIKNIIKNPDEIEEFQVFNDNLFSFNDSDNFLEKMK